MKGLSQPQDILCFSSIDWDFMWQGHQEIMSTLARQGHRVLFVENTGVRNPGLRDFGRIQRRFTNWKKGLSGFRKEAENLYVFSPLVFPFPYFRPARWFNRILVLFYLRRWMRAMDFYQPICWTFLPTPLTLELLQQIPHKLLIYYCIDSFVDSTPAAKRIVKSEEALFCQADLVFVTSQKLYETASRWNKRVHRFPFGVSFEKFNGFKGDQTQISEELSRFPRPVVGYVGGVHQWVDQDLLIQVARQHQDYSFVLVGSQQTDVEQLRAVPNIYLLGQKPHDALPYYLSHFDVGIIPYRITNYTQNVYPTKLNEYHAAGIAVVSTALPEVLAFNQTYQDLVGVGTTVEEFGEALGQALRNDSKNRRQERFDTARNNSWSRRIVLMQELIGNALAKQVREPQENWTSRFSAALKTSYVLRRSVVSFLITMILLFYTPFVWLLAQPLKVKNILAPSDAIVVFGGGVGELGKPGKHYRQQILKAVELFEEGYAPRILFVSGHMHAFHETDIMRLLTESLGVSKEAIMTEPRVKNTYQYVQRVGEICEDRGWNSIVLLTAPYNGRRAALAFRKNVSGMNVYVTNEKTRYDAPDWRIRHPYEIYRVFHEYTALLYYRWKGWI